jgi:hypothetical protein
MPEIEPYATPNTDQTVRRSKTAGLRNPDIGRRLPRLLAAAGLELAEVAGRAVPAPGLAHAQAQAQFHLFDHLDTAVRNGAVSAGQASAWREQIQAADAAGHAVVTPVAFPGDCRQARLTAPRVSRGPGVVPRRRHHATHCGLPLPPR